MPEIYALNQNKSTTYIILIVFKVFCLSRYTNVVYKTILAMKTDILIGYIIESRQKFRINYYIHICINNIIKLTYQINYKENRPLVSMKQ